MEALTRKLGWAAGLVALAACGTGEPTRPEAVEVPPGQLPPAEAADGAAPPPGLDAGPLADAGPDGAAPYELSTRDVSHVLGTGQSLAVGSQGTPLLSTTQPFDNYMFNTGPVAGGVNLSSFVPLTERGVETMSSALAALATQMAETEVLAALPPPRNKHRILVSVHGVGGTAYAGLKKGTAPYANGMAQVTAARDITQKTGLTYVVRAVTNVHGESDHIAGNAAYEQNLVEWQADYEKDVRAITLQPEPIPMFQTQVSSWTRYGQATSLIPQAQLDAHVKNQGKIILVGPKYFLPYADGVHLTGQGYRWLGEYYAKAYRTVVLEGRAFEPVRPKSARIAGNDVIVDFHVPSPPLVFDTQRVTAVANMGFELSNGAARPPIIQSVTIMGPDKVRIQCATTPPATTRVRYAFTGNALAFGGPRTGPRGNLRDSDPTKSRNGDDLFNWSVHFDVPVQ